MESPVDALTSLFERVEDYSKTTIELYKLRLIETATNVVTSLISRMSVLLVFSLFLLVFSTGIALFLGELLGKIYYGFFVVAGFYLLAGIVMHFFLGNWIKGSVSESIIRQTLEKDKAWQN